MLCRPTLSHKAARVWSGEDALVNVGVEKQAYLDKTLNHCQAYVMINFTSRQSAGTCLGRTLWST